jgi:hypothetical protein
MTDAPVCPRCRGFIPSNSRPGAYMGAISRIDNKTEVCSDCGTEEALLLLASSENWPVYLYFDEELSGEALHRSFERVRLIEGTSSKS